MVTITEHNINFYLEAYAREWQPEHLPVPCDREGNEIVIPAPSRAVVQYSVQRYDINRLLGKNVSVRFLPPTDYAHRALIYDPEKPEFTFDHLGPGLTIASQGVPYVYTTFQENEGGLERVAEIVRESEQWGEFFRHTLAPGLSIVSQVHRHNPLYDNKPEPVFGMR